MQIVTDTLHGQSIPDPYRWLEGDDKGNVTPEVAAWTDAQNARTRSVLDHLPGRSALESRVRDLMQVTTVSSPKMAGHRYFYQKRKGSQNQAVVYVRESRDGPDRILLDPNALDPKGLLAIPWIRPSHDGALLAYGAYSAGDENAVCHILDVATGKQLDGQIEGRVDSVDWLPDSSGFVYHRLANVKNPYSGQINFHRVGDPVDRDRVIFEQYKEGPLATTWGPFASLSYDGRWLALGYATSTKSNDLWVLDFARYLRTGKFDPIEIVKGVDAAFTDPAVINDTLYMQTTLESPNGRVVAVDLANPRRDQWRTIVPERKDAVIDTLSTAKDTLAIEYQKSVTTRIELFDLAGKSLGPVTLPGLGTATLSTREDRTEAFVRYTSFNMPPTIYRLDLIKPNDLTLWQRPDVPVDPDTIEVHQVTYNSKDGTPVPMFVVHRKGLTLDGNNPTLLTAYGGFGVANTPYFSATLFPWYEAGGVFCVANIRGGGEFGEAWHTAGMLANKQTVFDDFIAAGEWLIANKYTNPSKLGITGGSNGGLLTGACVTQRPDLFAAAYVGVPLLDMLRYQNFLMARYWVPEYGSAEDPKQFDYLLKYSPYHHVKPGTKYPAVFLTAGENDTRVHPMHARKMAAALQAATASDPSEKPVLLWVDRSTGHGMGQPLSDQIRDNVDRQLFFRWQLGMTGNNQ